MKHGRDAAPPNKEMADIDGVPPKAQYFIADEGHSALTGIELKAPITGQRLQITVFVQTST
jgi:hypothetical protein